MMYQVKVGSDQKIGGFEGTLYIYDNAHCGQNVCNGQYSDSGESRWGKGKGVRLSGRIWLCLPWCFDIINGWII